MIKNSVYWNGSAHRLSVLFSISILELYFAPSEIALLKPIGKQFQFPLMAVAEIIATYYCYQLITEFKWGLKRKWEQSKSHIVELMNESAQARRAVWKDLERFRFFYCTLKFFFKKKKKKKVIVLLSAGLLPPVFQNWEDIKLKRQRLMERTIPAKM